MYALYLEDPIYPAKGIEACWRDHKMMPAEGTYNLRD